MAKISDNKATSVGRKNLAAADRQQQMVDRAIALFAQKGFALTTRELAKGLQVTQPLLYRYFPSKQLLIEQVYQQVFMNRWDPEWEPRLKDRTVPLKERLIEYFIDYSQAILSSEWVRIFLYAGLQDPSLNQRYLKRLHEHIFLVINDEIRHQNHVTALPSEHELELQIEVLWGFHSSFFYLGVRKWVYQMPVPENLPELITRRVDAFLDGALSRDSVPTH
nr:TetR/AcrR family transcriptional regulator [Pseudomonas sp. FFPRI_1]